MNWWNLFLFTLLIAGHTQLWVAFVNRLHALPIPHAVLRHSRHVHDLAILSFPLLLLWFVGLTGPRLLTYGQWSDLSSFWMAVASVCAIGVIGLLVATLRYQWRSTPRAVLLQRSEIVDLERQLGRRLIGTGPYESLARVPWNEQFSVELSEKRLALPRLPMAWEGMSILHLSDWHLMPTIERAYFEAVTAHIAAQPVDLVAFTGDLIDDMQCVDWLPETLGRLEAPLGQFFILGNHDWEQNAEEIRASLSSLGWQSVGSEVLTVEHAGHRMAIAGDETPWLGRVPDMERANDADFGLLLSHTPDHFARARKSNVDLMLSGHNHGGQVVLPLFGPVYSPSWQGVRYAAGTFAKSQTVMHVSRGLAGRHPLRWRCRPEVTRLVLERDTA